LLNKSISKYNPDFKNAVWYHKTNFKRERRQY